VEWAPQDWLDPAGEPERLPSIGALPRDQRETAAVELEANALVQLSTGLRWYAEALHGRDERLERVRQEAMPNYHQPLPARGALHEGRAPRQADKGQRISV